MVRVQGSVFRAKAHHWILCGSFQAGKAADTSKPEVRSSMAPQI